MFMHKLIICSTLLLCWSFAAQAQSSVSLKDAKFPEVKPAEVLPEPEKPKTTSSSTSTSTTSTTIKPTTSTTPASSSTSTTTTTTTKTTSTTEPPKTTTTPAPVPTTTPAPQPMPQPSVGHWNSSCIKLEMAAQLNFTYETKDGKMANGLYNIPADAKVEDSMCDSVTIQTIQLNWGPLEAQHSLALQFDKNNVSTMLTMIKISLPLMSDNFPNAKDNETIQLLHRGSDFNTPEKMSYHCTRAQKFNLTETIDAKDIIGLMTVSHVQVEAFRGNKTNEFSTVHDCDSSETSDVVPIAVGIALAALILVVLISYLCARRRSTSRGYMSF